jgi:hypothetical protein
VGSEVSIIYDIAPNTGPSKIALREMLREAVANTASLKVTRCARGASGIQENAGYAALGAERVKAAERFAGSFKPVIAGIGVRVATEQNYQVRAPKRPRRR